MAFRAIRLRAVPCPRRLAGRHLTVLANPVLRCPSIPVQPKPVLACVAAPRLPQPNPAIPALPRLSTPCGYLRCLRCQSKPFLSKPRQSCRDDPLHAARTQPCPYTPAVPFRARPFLACPIQSRTGPSCRAGARPSRPVLSIPTGRYPPLPNLLTAGLHRVQCREHRHQCLHVAVLRPPPLGVVQRRL